jgi:hypothetical protein
MYGQARSGVHIHIIHIGERLLSQHLLLGSIEIP